LSLGKLVFVAVTTRLSIVISVSERECCAKVIRTTENKKMALLNFMFIA